MQWRLTKASTSHFSVSGASLHCMLVLLCQVELRIQLLLSKCLQTGGVDVGVEGVASSWLRYGGDEANLTNTISLPPSHPRDPHPSFHPLLSCDVKPFLLKPASED